MPATLRGKAKPKSEEKILDQATDRLLRAVKVHVARKGKKLTGEQLLKEGYSERFAARVERA